MVEKSMVSAKIAERTKERLDEYADTEGISRSQAIGRMLKQGLDVEESDMRLIPVQTDGGTKLENQISEVDEEVGELEQTVQSIRTALESEQKANKQSTALIVFSLFWIGIELSIGFSPLVTFVTGIPLVIGLLYYTFRGGA
jgi:antitoxin component of RelBE/YafQ-DinJ toxin-antitoxin module